MTRHIHIYYVAGVWEVNVIDLFGSDGIRVEIKNSPFRVLCPVSQIDMAFKYMYDDKIFYTSTLELYVEKPSPVRIHIDHRTVSRRSFLENLEHLLLEKHVQQCAFEINMLCQAISINRIIHHDVLPKKIYLN